MADILFISSTGWGPGDHLGTQHQLARQLARRHRLFFLELPSSPLSGLTGRRPGGFRRGLVRWLAGGRHRVEGVLVLTPPPVLPLRYHGLTGRCNQALLAAFLRRRLAREEVGEPLVVTFQADSAALVRRLPARRRVYWCTDDWSASGRWWQPARLVRRREEELVRQCDQVISVSRNLCRRFAALGVDPALVPNGVDLERFDPERAGPPPPAVRDLPRPVVGFAGIMTSRSFDAPLLTRVARRRREWCFLLVGRSEGKVPGLAELLAEPNVRAPGFRPPAELPAWVGGMDVCLIPWTENEWVASAFPLKFFEYLAMGKAVAARAGEVYRDWEEEEGLVYTWQGAAELEAAVARALAEDGPGARERRIALARRNGWDRRAAVLLDLAGVE